MITICVIADLVSPLDKEHVKGYPEMRVLDVANCQGNIDIVKAICYNFVSD